MSEWQPIETAPKYQEILGAHQVTGKYASGAWMLAVYSFAAGKWRGDGGEPSHWMPLPAPPSTFQPIGDVVGRIVARVTGDE